MTAQGVSCTAHNKTAMLFLALVILTTMAGCDEPSPQTAIITSDNAHSSRPEAATMILTSDNFRDRGNIPRQFTCQGQDASPQLSWKGAPDGTKSFALAVIDPDARGWVHWLVYNIPPGTTGFPQGASTGIQVMNDFGKESYGGPCPPSGTHRYVFTLYALDTADLGKVGKENFFAKVGEHAIQQASLVGSYRKS